MKKTPLYDMHEKYGGKIIDFGGWALPVQYSGIIQEHETVRNTAGIFDVSHMGEIRITGADATAFIQKMITNDILPMKPYQALYSPMCYPDGGIVDDLLVYKFDNKDYLLVVNASNTSKDLEWLKQHQDDQVKIENLSNHYAQLALQGPAAEPILQKLTSERLAEIKFFHFKSAVNLNGIEALVSRTGYTGEDGFEIYTAAADAPTLWEMLLEIGRADGLAPIGLGARDTLRFEATLPLYGQEITQEISPLEAKLGYFVNLAKEDFIGKTALLKQKEDGLKRQLIGFEMLDRGIPRTQYEVQIKGSSIGFVTTGSFSPSLKKNIGLALVSSTYTGEGTEIDIMIRNKVSKAKIIKTPFYNKNTKK